MATCEPSLWGSQPNERLLALAHSPTSAEFSMNMNMNAPLLSATAFCQQYEALARQIESLYTSRQVHPHPTSVRRSTMPIVPTPRPTDNERQRRSEPTRRGETNNKTPLRAAASRTIDTTETQRALELLASLR